MIFYRVYVHEVPSTYAKSKKCGAAKFVLSVPFPVALYILPEALLAIYSNHHSLSYSQGIYCCPRFIIELKHNYEVAVQSL